MSTESRQSPRSVLPRGGVTGNARLTALTGMLLLVLLAAEGATLLGIRTLFVPHVFIGLLLIPPIVLKLGSTGYRFVLYYTGNRAYREAGPPHPVLRVTAPPLVLLTVLLFTSGIILLVAGPQNDGPWRTLHTASFFLWFWAMSIHVLGHIERATRLTRADLLQGRLRGTSGRIDRRVLVAGSLAAGLIVAITVLPWDASWLHWLTRFRPG